MDLDVDIPRANGEPVFEEPWQSRAFGMVLAMYEAGACPWDEFKDRLISEIAADPDGPYYERWLAAFERVVVDAGLVDPDALAERAREAVSETS